MIIDYLQYTTKCKHQQLLDGKTKHDFSCHVCTLTENGIH